MKHSILSIDIETYSDVDLTKCGVYAYTDQSQLRSASLLATPLMTSLYRS